MPLLSISPYHDTAANCAYGAEEQTASFANTVKRVMLRVENWDIMIASLEEDGEIPIGLFKAQQSGINAIRQRNRSDFEM